MRNFTIGHCDGAYSMLDHLKPVFRAILGPDTNIKFVKEPPSDPDILVYSVFGQSHKRYNCRKILICGEPMDMSRHRPDLIIDCKNVPRLRSPGRFAYVPFYVTSFVERFQNKPRDLIKPANYNVDDIFRQKTKFCAFLYSQNVDFRNSLYDVVSRYKPVDALGRARSGIANKATDRGVYEVGRRTYNDLAVQKYRPYKFVICCENSRHPGYVTEKMVSAMLANAIPIYLGAPDVVEHFNPNSFVNIASYPSWEAAVSKVKELDENPQKYKQVLAQPWCYNNELNNHFKNDLLQNNIRQVINSPATSKAQIQRKVAVRAVPKIGSATARNLRMTSHYRAKASRLPVAKLGSAVHLQLRKGLKNILQRRRRHIVVKR